jgi:serine/threonine-protein kinase RsbW
MAADAEGSSTVEARPSAVDGPRRARPADNSRWRGPGWRVFDARPGHGKHARDWIARITTWHGCPVDPDDAALLVSELFTNALMHGPRGGRVLVGYCLWPGGARIVVCDGGGATPPRLRDPDEMDEGGRGLRVVDAVAAAWGSFRAGHAQAVWCDLGKPLDGIADSETRAWLLAILATVALAAPPATTAVVGDLLGRASAGRHRSLAPA